MVGPDTFPFSHAAAFERNLGLISAAELERLSNSLVAIAGCGGAGGAHALTLARLGVGRFRIADPDTFSLANFNRQVGATTATIGRNKAVVTAEQIQSINPKALVEVREAEVTGENAADFVRGADLVLDGIDFFSLPARRQLFAAAWDASIPAITAAPLGFSGTLHVFAPGGLSFDDYFDLRDGQSKFDQLTNFILGLAPAALQRSYVDLRTVNLTSGRGPVLDRRNSTGGLSGRGRGDSNPFETFAAAAGPALSPVRCLSPEAAKRPTSEGEPQPPAALQACSRRALLSADRLGPGAGRRKPF